MSLQPLAPCLSCSVARAGGGTFLCDFVAWGSKCNRCRVHDQKHCTFELTPSEADKLYQSQNVPTDSTMASEAHTFLVVTILIPFPKVYVAPSIPSTLRLDRLDRRQSWLKVLLGTLTTSPKMCNASPLTS